MRCNFSGRNAWTTTVMRFQHVPHISYRSLAGRFIPIPRETNQTMSAKKEYRTSATPPQKIIRKGSRKDSEAAPHALVRAVQPSGADLQFRLREQILSLLRNRAKSSTCCPSEVSSNSCTLCLVTLVKVVGNSACLLP